jgi:cell division septal protein FtsQ
MPEIRRADVVRALPNRLTILVEERRPFTLVHAGRLHWLDDEGHVLGEETRAVAPEVPIISGLTEEELATMRTAPTTKARDAITLIRALLRSRSAWAPMTGTSASRVSKGCSPRWPRRTSATWTCASAIR